MPYADIEKRREVKRNYMKRYRAEHPDEYREYCRMKGAEWVKKNPLAQRQKRWAYKARKRMLDTGNVNIAKLVELWDGLCGICRQTVDDKFEIDHIKPLSKGGLHDQSNLQLTHQFCNRSKGNKI